MASKIEDMVFACNHDQHNVRVFKNGQAGGRYGSGQGKGDGQLWHPQDVVVLDGRLFVSEISGKRVSVFDIETKKFVCHLGNEKHGPGQLTFPAGMCASQGLLFVADTDKISVFRPSDGDHLGSFGSQGNGEGQPGRVVV